MISFTLFVASLHFSNIAVASSSNGYVWTPHGLRLSQCVHRATESEAIIESILNMTHDGVLVSYPISGTNVFYPTLPECVKEAAELSMGVGEDHGWQQNLVQDNTPPIGSFEGYYTLPNETPASDGQVLSFFIGMENKGQSDVSIIQPCIRYEGGSSKWSMASWNCCPNGQSHEGNVVQLPTNAKNIYGLCTANSSHIFVKAEYEGKISSITQPTNGRIFNSIDVTLEQHGAEHCDDYNKKPFNFTNLKIKKENGETFTPNWKVEHHNDSCHGGIKMYNEYNAAIWGADKPQ
eukprot:465350_1